MGPDPVVPLPVQLDVRGRRCVVVGAGAVGTRRVTTLLDHGARVVVVAPDVSDLVAAFATDGRIELHRRRAVDGDVDGALLVVACTGDDAVDRSVADAARSRGVLVNRAGDGGAGDLAFPAVVRRGPVRVAVSTGGAAPAVARLLAGRLEEGLDQLWDLTADDLVALVEVVAEVRATAPAVGGEEGVTPAPLDWRSALDASILDLIRQGRRAEAKERLLACLSSS